MPEMAPGHDLGCVTGAGRRVDDGRPDGHQVTDPDLVKVFAAGGRVGDISAGEDALRLAGLRVGDYEGSCPGVLYQVGGCGRVVAGVCRGQRWPRDVCDGGQGRWWRWGCCVTVWVIAGSLQSVMLTASGGRCLWPARRRSTTSVGSSLSAATGSGADARTVGPWLSRCAVVGRGHVAGRVGSREPAPVIASR